MSWFNRKKHHEQGKIRLSKIGRGSQRIKLDFLPEEVDLKMIIEEKCRPTCHPLHPNTSSIEKEGMTLFIAWDIVQPVTLVWSASK